ncbi:MAG: hypothetical protein A3G18_10430 [Rhodospirillales bacterium RIFCSPLOWO2_12_FULL_58_28]|nr:MAG: hypothetical protein A3G18_10430 [Rhodospirillales bacterium RIFCSPLOWO2_12_FULL_58_28]
MDGFIHNFIGADGQVSVLLSVLALWAGLSIIGAAVGTRHLIFEAAPIYGWAAAAALFTTVGAVSAVPFTYIAWVSLALTLPAAVHVCRREGRLFVAGAGKILVMAVPLLLLASAMVPSQWDEFSNWLPNARFLINNDGFPGAADAETGSSFPAYPYGWTLLTYMTSKLAGRFVENAGGPLNVLLLLTFGMVLTRVVLVGIGKKGPAGHGWGLAALAVLAGFAFNPTFSQKIVLTAYADTPSAVVLGVGGALGWMMLNALADGEKEKARDLALQFGLAMMVLVNLKQTGFVLFVFAVIGVLLAGLMDSKIRFSRLVRLVPLMALPAAAIHVIWISYVAAELSAYERNLLPYANWNINLIPQILHRMLIVLSRKGAYFTLMTVVVIFAVRGLWRRRDAMDRLAVIVASVFLGYNAFLLFMYVAGFGADDAKTVTSFWRYNMHLGPLGMVFGAYGLARLWQDRLALRLDAKKFSVAAVVLALALPVAFSSKLRFDREPPKPHFLAVAARLPDLLPEGSRFIVLDPKGSGESAMMVRYFLGLKRRMVGFNSAYHGQSLDDFRKMLTPGQSDAIIIHSVVPALREALGMELADDASYLLGPGDGGWRIDKTWLYPREDR